MITKEQIPNLTDEELVKAVAEICMGWVMMKRVILSTQTNLVYIIWYINT